MELRELLDGAVVNGLLVGRGLSAAAADAKTGLFAAAARALIGARSGDDSTCAHAFFVPGRIEVLGKHTDYAGGSSIVAAVEQGFCLVSVPRQDREVSVCALDREVSVCALDREVRVCAQDREAETVSFNLDPDLQVRHGHWSNYPMTVVRRLARNFPECRLGMDLAFASDLPPAAGMSSSSALIVATFLALAAANRLSSTEFYRRQFGKGGVDLAAYLGTIENGQSFGELSGDRGVGTFGGSEDHTAILCSQPRRFGQFAYCPARFQRHIPLPPDIGLVLADSGVVAEKTGAAQELYNQASGRVSALVQRWQRGSGREEIYLADILASDPAAADRLRGYLARADGDSFSPDELRQRLDHFVAESDLIGPAGDALAAGDLAEFGRLVDRSQQLSEELLGNQVAPTIGLARLARQGGALAASAFGAGFGGSVWALVKKRDRDAFAEAWSASYRRDFPEAGGRSAFFQTDAGPAAFELGEEAT